MHLSIFSFYRYCVCRYVTETLVKDEYFSGQLLSVLAEKNTNNDTLGITSGSLHLEPRTFGGT
jgi:hypothetical protein